MDLETAEKLLRNITNETNLKHQAWLRAKDRWIEAENRRSDAVDVMLRPAPPLRGRVTDRYGAGAISTVTGLPGFPNRTR